MIIVKKNASDMRANKTLYPREEKSHRVIMKAIPLRAKALSGIKYHRNWFGRSVRHVRTPEKLN